MPGLKACPFYVASFTRLGKRLSSKHIGKRMVGKLPMITSRPLTMPDFNWHQLKQLAGEDTDFEIELLTMFLKDAQKNLAELDQAIATCSLQSVEEIAHSLRGASANVGASALASAAGQLEQLARSGKLSEAQNLLEQIRTHSNRIQDYLKDRVEM